MNLHEFIKYYQLPLAIGIGLIIGFIVTLLFRYYRHLPHPNPKTRIQWLTHLPRRYRHSAICYAYEAGGQNNEADSCSHALAESFGWRITKEGKTYWSEIYQKQLEHEIQSKR